MKYLLSLFSLFLAFAVHPAAAAHLVGGDFQITYVGNFTYDIQLNVYGDNATLTTGNQDNSVDVSIFEKGTNQRLDDFRIPLVSTAFVPYANAACQANSIRTKILTYRIRRTLFPGVYTPGSEYYIVWERCCRNIGITNLRNPGTTGMVFYAEFPPVTQNNQPFVNSSPVLPPIPPEFLCVNELYQYSMRSTDPDGDSLVYMLAVPMKGYTTQDAPLTKGRSGPYPAVDWQPGYGLNQMIQGTPALNIDSRTGLLSVRPNLAGLFVFGIKILEYRNGVKIGETFRDVQVKVNNCPKNNPPVIKLRAPGASRDYQPGDTLVVSDATDWCFPFTFSDPEQGQVLSLKVVPLNFNQAPVISPSQVTVLQAGQVFNATICWPDCNLNSPTDLFHADLIVSDNACGAIASDTLRLTFRIIPKPNQKPAIRTQGLPGNTATVTIGETLNFNLISTDSVDNDQLSVRMIGIGFNPASFGMTLAPLTGQGRVVSNFSWSPGCNALDFREVYKVQFRVRDNSCYSNHEDSVTVLLRLIDIEKEGPEFIAPNIFTPNGDGYNDRFEMPNLPIDNCSDNFEELKIFSRWGTLVYSSRSRNFAWDGKNVSDGVYFYLIKYRKKQYKGTVTIVK